MPDFSGAFYLRPPRMRYLFGLAERYSEVFDLKRFGQARRRYIEENVLQAAEGGFEYEILELARKICKEPWADCLRRRQYRKETLRKIKGRVGEYRARTARRIKKIARSASAVVGNIARRLQVR